MSRGKRQRGRNAARGTAGPETKRSGTKSHWSRRTRARLGRVTSVIIVSAAAITIIWRMFRYSLPGVLGATTIPSPRETPPVSGIAQADFVGAERCASCHASEFAKWKASVHGRAGGPPSPDVVIAAFNGSPIRFRDAVVTPRIRNGTYEFVVARDDDSTEVVRVDGVIGRGHMEGGGTQGFVTKRGDGTMRFVPFDWSRHGNNWFCNTNSRAQRGWVPITAQLRLSDCGDWPPARVLGDTPRWANCQSCHASQLRISGSETARTTTLTSLAINCESCHGPARRHVELAESGALANRADVGLVSLRTLGKDASLRVCFQCHTVKDQLREGYVSGDSLELFYSLKFPALGDRPLDANGRVRTFAYQEGHTFSDCYLNGGMTCTSCHDPHTQGYRTVAGEAIPGRVDNRQCTACHASKAERVVEHTHHTENSAGSRCTSCHMPYLQQPETTDPRTGRALVKYTRSDHTIAIPRSGLGVSSTCASCHANRSVKLLDDQVKSWWGSLKPENEFSRSRVFARLARDLEAVAVPDEGLLAPGYRAHVDSLSRDPDIDTRALALATLHLAAGNDASVRRELARAAAREGSHDFPLRSRWAVALGFMGDRFAEGGNYPGALTAYLRGLEVTPDNPRLLQSIGNAQRASGDYAEAIASYERALVLDRRNALTMVNLGIVLGAAGDSLRGENLFRSATQADPDEPLGWFNLGNVALLKGDFSAATKHYERALTLDGALVQAHFQLARIHLLQKDNRAALTELRRGLAIDSSDVAARNLARQLGKSPKP